MSGGGAIRSLELMLRGRPSIAATTEGLQQVAVQDLGDFGVALAGI